VADAFGQLTKITGNSLGDESIAACAHNNYKKTTTKMKMTKDDCDRIWGNKTKSKFALCAKITTLHKNHGPAQKSRPCTSNWHRRVRGEGYGQESSCEGQTTALNTKQTNKKVNIVLERM
jgi:hypothetical protein